MSNFKIKYDPSISVIVSHYKEDLKWVDDYFPEHFKIYVYTKSNDKPNLDRPFEHKYLKNVGRNDHSYLYHIINNYNSLSDINIFITGSSNSLSHKLKCLNSVMKNLHTKDLQPTWNLDGKYVKGMRTFSIKGESWCASDRRNRSDCRVIGSEFINLGDFMDKVIQLGDIHKLIWWGVFSVKKNRILNHDKSFYEKIIKHLEYGDNIETSHFMERLWAMIFS